MIQKPRSACCSGGDDQAMTRRELLAQAGRGIGSVAIASMLGGSGIFAGGASGLPNLPHFRPRARRAIWLFPAGAPSQLDTWDYKPKLREMFGKELPGFGPRQPAPDHDDRAPEGLPGRAQSLHLRPGRAERDVGERALSLDARRSSTGSPSSGRSTPRPSTTSPPPSPSTRAISFRAGRASGPGSRTASGV